MPFRYKLNNILCHCRFFSTKSKKSLKTTRNEKFKSFDELFNYSNSQKSLQTEKVSKENSFDALYQECMTEIYKMRAEADCYSDETRESPEIQELTKKENEIVNSVFKRVFSSNLTNLNDMNNKLNSNKSSDIDPYWDPFKNIQNLKLQIASEFNQLSKLVSSVELYKYKSMIKKSLRQFNESYNFDIMKDTQKNSEDDIDYKYKNERFWDPDIDKRLILENNKRPFSFRDLHVLHNFVSEDGQILPRRLNLTTRKQQIQIFKSIKIARQMALFPYDWKPLYRDRIPLLNPLQYLFDELFYKYKKSKDLRSKAMINVMINKYPDVNAHRYLKYELQKMKRTTSKDSEVKDGNIVESNS
ncbi:ribosomal protein S18 [Theileria orientalis]|uniref:Ribosomal protein S18 n=1 Tax=Theileria orientalis TaxID=68886 RepID=A0A976MCC2_THEOR|nr:ribosomal protein S18 [Theileria orientalis]